MKTIITSVGTSLFTNYFEEEDTTVKNHYERLKNKFYKEWEHYEDSIKRLKDTITNWIPKTQDASAEIKSIFKIKEFLNDEEIRVHLLATDTILSVLAAEIVKEYFERNGVNCDFDIQEDKIQDLQITDAKDFEKNGIVSLVERLDKIINSSYFENVVFNITGGYKAIIPYMTIMAQINNVPIYYIFEDTDTLIKIPQSPIDINWSIFEKYHDILEELNKGIYDWQNYKIKQNIGQELEGCIWEDGDMAELNALGKMFWNKYKSHFIVKIIKESNFFSEKAGNRKEILEALQELYKRLKDYILNNKNKNEDLNTVSLIKSIKNLGDKHDLRHGTNPDADKFIFKSTKKTQIRIVYKPEIVANNLELYVYDFVRGNFDHSKYIKDFKSRIKIINERDFITIPIRKPYMEEKYV